MDKFWGIFGLVWGFLICCVAVAMLPALIQILAELLISIGHVLMHIYDWLERLSVTVRIVTGVALALYSHALLLNRRSKS